MKYECRDIAPYALNRVMNRIRQFLETGFVRVFAQWWRISLGKNIQFCGMPLLRRHPTARIIIGNNCFFRSAEWSNSTGLNRRCFIEAGRNARITIGENCGFSGTVIAAFQSITIGKNVLCGANCTIVDNDRHHTDYIARKNNEEPVASPIVIEDDVFLGMNVVVLKGCTIGRGTVVAASSVVTHSLPAGVLAVGIPARVVRELSSE